MKYVVTLNEKDMTALMKIIEEPYDNDDDIIVMKEDISLFEALVSTFKNDDARSNFETILAGYKANLRSIS